MNRIDTLEELERNARFRASALQPVIDELKQSNLQIGALITQMIESSRQTHELIIELIRRTK